MHTKNTKTEKSKLTLFFFTYGYLKLSYNILTIKIRARVENCKHTENVKTGTRAADIILKRKIEPSVFARDICKPNNAVVALDAYMFIKQLCPVGRL